MQKNTLVTGLRIGNFSSPHPFTFVDGTVLGACAPERARGLMLDAVEKETPGLVPGVVDIELRFDLNATVEEALVAACADVDVDVVIVPLPVMTAVKAAGKFAAFNKIRVIRVADRVLKTIHGDRFCL